MSVYYSCQTLPSSIDRPDDQDRFVQFFAKRKQYFDNLFPSLTIYMFVCPLHMTLFIQTY